MTPLQEIAMIFGMMAVTFAARYPMMALSGRVKLPPAIEAALKFVPVAVLTALCTPIMFKPEGVWFVSVDNAHLMAGITAILLAAWSRHLLLTIVLGMSLFLVLHLYF